MERFEQAMQAGAAEIALISQGMVAALSGTLHRKGVVLGISGGIDSAVCASVAVKALGAERVFGLLMPERDSSGDDSVRATELCKQLGIRYVTEDLGDSLAALGCYSRRDDAIRRVFPNYGPGWKQKIVIGNDSLTDDRLPYFDLVVRPPQGDTMRARMPADVYLAVVAATNMKQRMRKLMESSHADALNYAVLGTPNRVEYELGFFVRGGDGLADLKPIAHLYKAQVYALAAHLGVPQSIRSQQPSTGTYSLTQTQEEFYYGLPWQAVDRLLWAMNNNEPASSVAFALNMNAAQVERAWRDMAGKRRLAKRNLADAILMQPLKVAS